MKKIQLFIALFSLPLLSISQDFMWGKNFGGVGEDVVRAMAVDDEGNTYTTGYFTDISDFDPSEETVSLSSEGFFDIFIQKLDTEGNLVWAKSFGANFFDYGTGIEVDADGNIYVTGVFQETVDFDPGSETFELASNGGEDIFALKLDSDGNFVWAASMGSSGYEEPVSIGVDALGNVYLAGYFSQTIDFDPGEEIFEVSSNGGQDAFVVKLNASGQFLWAGNLGGPEGDIALGMDVDSAGDMFVTGYFSGTADFDPTEGEFDVSTIDDLDGFVTKINALGEHVYTASFGGIGTDIAWDVALDNEGNAFAAGEFSGDFQTGFDSPVSSAGNSDAFVVKINPFGSVEWAGAIQGSGFQNAYDVNTDPFGNVVLAGYFGDEADFDPSDEEVLISSTSSEPFDAFVSILSGSGEFIYAGGFGGSNFTEHHGVDTDADGNIYLSAAFQNTVDLDPSPNEDSEASVVAFRDSYVIKLSAVTALSADTEEREIVRIYPNPVSDFLLIDGGMNQTYTITDLKGKVVAQGINRGRQLRLDNLRNGLYVIKVEGFKPVKIVKQ